MSSPTNETSPGSTTPSSPAVKHGEYFSTSTPNIAGKKLQTPLNVTLPSIAPPTSIYGEPTLTPPPRSPGTIGDTKSHPPDGTSSDKSSETAVANIRTPTAVLTRKESYKAQRQHYRKEKKRVASALLHSIEDPSVVVLADWLKVRGSLKSWTKLWCVLKPGILLLYKSPKAKSSHWVGTILLTSCQVIERPSKKDGFCFKLYHPLEQSIWAPRGPHNETIGAVVQPLPTAHLIFRAPSQAAGHCWLDGLELALRSSNAMLRCSRNKPEELVLTTDFPDAPNDTTELSHEELEKHFNEHELEGAASDSDSDDMEAQDKTVTKQEVLKRIKLLYTEDPDRECGASGELVEEVCEENKSLLWFILKQVRPGMDLSKVVLPTFILEPRSFLDKLSDNYYHADILEQASNEQAAYNRFVLVLKWYLSGMYKKPKGLKKPYNPVLGESFRCCWRHSEDCFTYYIAEQVSHHPPVSAFYISNRKQGFTIEGSLLAKSKFYGNSTSAILEGCARLRLLRWGETYVTTAPYAHCKGILIGTLSMELGGKINISCEQTGYSAEVEFKLKSFLGGSDTNAVSGRVKYGKETIATVEGFWDAQIHIKDKRNGEETTLVDVPQLKEVRLRRFLMKLDSQKDFESQKLWIHVSEAIAKEDQIAATEQKTIIEEAQRAKAKNVESPWQPRYFHKDLLATAPEGIVDQGWRYKYSNHEPWSSQEIIEYEEDFVIRSLDDKSVVVARDTDNVGLNLTLNESDTDSRDDLQRRSKTSTRTLKQMLTSIENTLREHTQAIERLNTNLESRDRVQRPSHSPLGVSWDLFWGFVFALMLQVIHRWFFVCETG